MAQTIYYIVAAIGIIFTGIMTYLTYKFNKKTKISEANVEKLATEIKEIYNEENRKRLTSENTSKLLHLFSNIESSLNEINKSDEVIKVSGISIDNTIREIDKIIAKISEYSFLFTENQNKFNSGDYDPLELLIDEHAEIFRTKTVKNIIRINSNYKSFLRSLQNEL